MIKHLLLILLICLPARISLAEPPDEGGYFGYITVYDDVLRCDEEVIEEGDSIYKVMAYCGRSDKTITFQTLSFKNGWLKVTEVHSRTYYRADDGDMSTLVVVIQAINERVTSIKAEKVYGQFDRSTE